MLTMQKLCCFLNCALVAILALCTGFYGLNADSLSNVPQNFTVKPYGYHTVELSYVLPERSLNIIVEFCRLRPDDTPYCETDHIPVLDQTLTRHVLEDLPDNYNYTFRMRVQLSNGLDGDWTNYVIAASYPASPPVLRKHYERNLVAGVDESFTLRCPYKKGEPAPSVVWYFNNTPISATGMEYKYTMEKKKLTIVCVAEDDAGYYECIAGNSLGEPVKANFTLTVLPMMDPQDDSISSLSDASVEESWTEPEEEFYAPVFVQQKHFHSKDLKVIVASDKLILRCPAKGNPPPTIRWERGGGKPLQLGRAIENPAEFYLKIKQVRPIDQGQYTCIVENRLGKIQHTYDVQVQERVKARPKITNLLPGDLTKTVGDNVSFTCEVYSDTTPHFVWMKWYNESHPLDLEEEQDHIRFLEACFLHDVNFDPKSITTCNDDPVRPYGWESCEEWMENVDWSCETFVQEILRKKPTFPLRCVSDSERAHIREHNENTDLSEAATELLITNITLDDAGKYTCVAGNYLGIGARSIWLKVEPDVGSTPLPTQRYITFAGTNQAKDQLRNTMLLTLVLVPIILFLAVCLVFQCRMNSKRPKHRMPTNRNGIYKVPVHRQVCLGISKILSHFPVKKLSHTEAQTC